MSDAIETAIKRLGQVRSTLGFVAVGEDPTQLYVRVEEDDDGEGVFTFGLSVGGGVDADEEINEAIALQSRTVDAQLEILRLALKYGLLAEGQGSRFREAALTLADAINGTKENK